MRDYKPRVHLRDSRLLMLDDRHALTGHPKASRSMYSAMELLGLEKLWVVIPSDISYPVTEQIGVCGLQAFRRHWCELA